MVTYGGFARFGTPTASPSPGLNSFHLLKNSDSGLYRTRNAERPLSLRKGHLGEKAALHPLLVARREAKMQ